MPKPIDLTLLGQVLFKQVAAKPELAPRPISDSFEIIEKPTRPILKDPNYFLFMLGTDTVYTHLPTYNAPDPKIKKTYENGETLSYMARVMAHTLGETQPEIRLDQPLSFSTASVDVVNGPSTMGSEIGERIALGVFLILKALSEGKSTVQIAAHSRGAVESILIAHELERIKKELQQNPKLTIYQILIASPCTYTKAAFKKHPFKEAGDSEEIRTALAKCLSTAKINLFLIDPVPGGSYMGLSHLAWRDERFYVKPPCSEAELLILRDERTRCFKPIVPAGMTPLIIPGHHGTASGNIYSQQSEAVAATIQEKDTSSVQHLVVIKLLNFINKNTGLFNSRVQPVELGHLELDVTTNHFLNQGKKERLEQLMDHYQRVNKNDNAFKHFTKTSYAYLGSEEEASSKSRMVHFGSHNSMGLATFAPGLDGPFVNSEHVLLYLHEQIAFSLERSTKAPDELVRQFTVILNNLFTEYSSGLSAKTNSTLDDNNTRLVLYQALSTFVDTISQTYLRNHLSMDAKMALIGQITKTFAILEGFKNNRNKARLNEYIDEFKSILYRNISRTVEIHYKSLIDRTKKLETEIDYVLTSDQEFVVIFNKFLTAIANKALEQLQEKPDVSQALKTVRDELLKSSPQTIDEARARYRKQIETLSNNKVGNDAIAILTALAEDQKNGLQQHLLSDLPTEAELLSELDRLYENVSSLIIGTDQIKTLVGKEPFILDLKELDRQKDQLIKLAAGVFIKQNLGLSKKLINISDAFFVQIQLKALAMKGIKSEAVVVAAHADKVIVNRPEPTKLSPSVASEPQSALQKQYDFIAQQLAELQKQYSILASQHSTLQKEKDSLEKSGRESTDQLANVTVLLSTSKLQLTTALHEAELLSQKISQGNIEHTQHIQQLESRLEIAKSQSEQVVKMLEGTWLFTEQAQAKQSKEILLLLAKLREMNELKLQHAALVKENFSLLSERHSHNAEKQRLNDLLVLEQRTSSVCKDEANRLLLQHDEFERGYKALRESMVTLIDKHLLEQGASQKDIQQHEKNSVELRQQLAAREEKDKALREVILARDNELATLKAQQKMQAEIVEQLLSPKEIMGAQFITDKLIPSTQDYLLHLTEQAQKLNPSFVHDTKNSHSFSGKAQDQGTYDKIITKYTATRHLLNDLTDQTTNPLPSARILKFTTSLKDTNNQLKEHRDSDWIHFFKTTMVAIGVVCSGIIPGIIVLLAYSSYEGKSPLFFTQSKGEQFVNKIADYLSNTGSEILAI